MPWNKSDGRQLWAAKRQNFDIYHTGYYSHVSPKLYARESDARAAANTLNDYRVRHFNSSPGIVDGVIPDDAWDRIRADYGKNKYWDGKDAQLDELTSNVLSGLNNEIAEGPWVVVPVEVNVKQ